MFIKSKLFAVLGATLLSVTLCSKAFCAPQTIYGLWLTESGNGKIMVEDCGNGTPCGTLYWLDETKVENMLDTKNSDPEKRTRPLLGSSVFWGFEEKNGKWKSGRIYDGESGKTYKSKIELLEDGTLKVKGCVGPICRSEIWSKVSKQ